MKKIIAIIKATALLIPALLVINESEHLWVNLIGLAYIGVMLVYSKTRRGQQMWRELLNNL